MPLDDFGWDMEVVRILGVHGNTVHQLIFVGELLVVELLLQVVHSIFVKNGQPNCRFVRSRPFDSVPFVGGNVHKIAGLQFQYIIFESKFRCTFQNNHPFMFVLVVPKSFRRERRSEGRVVHVGHACMTIHCSCNLTLLLLYCFFSKSLFR